MDFFDNITASRLIGVALLIAGAFVTFLSARISKNMQHIHANLITKIVGLAVAVVGFVLIML